jgi:hypothetical protein
MLPVTFAACGLPDRAVYDMSIYQTLTLTSQREAFELFDSETFIYDVITGIDANSFVILSPRLSELQSQYLQEKVLEQGFTIALLLKKIKSHIIVCDNPSAWQRLELGGRIYDLDKPNRLVAYLNSKRPRRISYTLQKDEDLRHIHDWVSFQFTRYAADAVVLFDNDSAISYAFPELADSVAAFGDSLVLDHVPFKYGPAGTTSDGELLKTYKDLMLQASMFEYIKSCILLAGMREALLLNTDIDELILCRANNSPFDLLPDDKHALLFNGLWCYPPASLADSEFASHDDHIYVDTVHRINNDRKWLLRVNRDTFPCWQSAHLISKMPGVCGPTPILDVDDCDAVFLHHYAVTNRWRGTRRSPKQEGTMLSVRSHEEIVKAEKAK